MKRIIYTVRCDTGTFYSPPPGRRWNILSGVVYHVTGTTSDAEINDAGSKMIDRLASIDTSFGTGYFPLFSFILRFAIGADAHFSMSAIPGEHIVKSSDTFRMVGGADSYANIQVEEVEEFEEPK